jgi:hypothetical protein
LLVHPCLLIEYLSFFFETERNIYDVVDGKKMLDKLRTLALRNDWNHWVTKVKKTFKLKNEWDVKWMTEILNDQKASEILNFICTFTLSTEFTEIFDCKIIPRLLLIDMIF